MKRKIYLELIITLAVGFLIGFFTNSIITDKRIKDYSLHKGESDFWRRALSEVNVSKEQQQAIRPIIKEHSMEARTILMKSWEEMLPIWEEMEQEILEVLSPEQQEQIKIIQSNRRKQFEKRIDKPRQRKQNGQRMQNGQGKKPNQDNREHKYRENRPEIKD